MQTNILEAVQEFYLLVSEHKNKCSFIPNIIVFLFEGQVGSLFCSTSLIDAVNQVVPPSGLV